MVHAHFQHRHLGILRHVQNRHGHTDVVVVIGRGLADPEGACQHRGDHLFCGALANRAGNRHHLGADALQCLPGDVTQGRAGVLHVNGRIVPNLPAAQHRSCALLHSRGDEIMSIPGALKGKEQLTGLQGPGVVSRALKGQIRIFFFHRSAAPFGSVPQCNLCHIIPSIPLNGQQPLPVRPGGACVHQCPDRSRGLFRPEQLYHFFPQCP